jgi:hypothetical protein
LSTVSYEHSLAILLYSPYHCCDTSSVALAVVFFFYYYLYVLRTVPPASYPSSSVPSVSIALVLSDIRCIVLDFWSTHVCRSVLARNYCEMAGSVTSVA